MKALITIMLALGIVGVAAAYDLGNQAPVKPVVTYPENVPNPERQGGDTIATAILIPPLPYSDSGTTAGYTDDYDEVCPYSGSHSPDVVYELVRSYGGSVDIDLCGSDYDTKLYVYSANLSLVACNDDYYFGEPCGMYVSKLECLFLSDGTYYIVIDGYGSAFGNYVLNVSDWIGGAISCPAGSPHEGEPPLMDNYVDLYNGGCNTPPLYPFQDLVGDAGGELVFCGVSGWYLYNGSNYRDTDWFRLVMGPTGTIEVAALALVPTYIFELGPQDCAAVGVIQQITVFGGPSTMAISGYQPGQVVWLWAGPTVFAPSSCQGPEYGYILWLSGLQPPVAAERTTWSTVKALYE